MAAQTVSPELCTIIATTAPFYMLALLAERKFILANQSAVLDYAFAAAVFVLPVVTLFAAIHADTGIDSRWGQFLFIGWGLPITASGGIYARAVIEESKERRRDT